MGVDFAYHSADNGSARHCRREIGQPGLGKVACPSNRPRSLRSKNTLSVATAADRWGTRRCISTWGRMARSTAPTAIGNSFSRLAQPRGPVTDPIPRLSTRNFPCGNRGLNPQRIDNRTPLRGVLSVEEISVKIQRDSVLSSGRKSRYCDIGERQHNKRSRPVSVAEANKLTDQLTAGSSGLPRLPFLILPRNRDLGKPLFG